MTKLEQVIKALQLCRYDPDPGQECKFLVSCDICPYWKDEFGCREVDLFNDALELLKERQWISVKDRLPEENEAVNVVWVNHNPASYYQHVKDKPLVATAVYYDGRWYWWNTSISDYLNEYGHVEFDRIDEGIEITHWQNLPEPPKEEVDEDHV